MLRTYVYESTYVLLKYDPSQKLPFMLQGRIQELEMGGAKLLGVGSGGRLRPSVGPGQSTTIGLSVRCQLTTLDFIYFINDLVII